jgi:hypothetical protein
VAARVDEKEKALENDLKQKFPVKVDDAALEKMPMPAPSAGPATTPVMPGGGGMRGPGGLPGMPRVPGFGQPPRPDFVQ